MNFSSPILHTRKLFHTFFMSFLGFLFLRSFFLFHFLFLPPPHPLLSPSTPIPQYSITYLGQEHILKSKFLWQSVLMSERLWVTLTAQQNLHHKSLKLPVSRCATAFVVLQNSSRLTSIISSALFSVLSRSFKMKEEGIHVNKLFKKTFLGCMKLESRKIRKAIIQN